MKYLGHWIRIFICSFNKIKIQYKLLAAFLILSIIPSLLVGVYFYRRSYSVVLNNAIKSTANTLYYINNHLSAKIEALDNISLSIVINKNISTKLNAADTLVRGRNRRDIENILSNIMISNRDILDISIIDNNKNIYGLTGSLASEDFLSKYATYYELASIHNGLNTWIGIEKESLIFDFSYSEQIPSVFVATAIIKDMPGYQSNAGLLLISVRTDAFLHVIENAISKNAETIMLLDDKKNIMLVSGENDRMFADIDFLPEMNGVHGYFTTFYNGKNTLVNYVRNDKTGWYTLSMISVSNLTSDIDHVLTNVIYISLGLLIVILLITLFVTYDISSGIKKLVEAMDTVKNGHFDIRIISRREDEIGFLYNRFDDMVQRIDYLIKTTYEQQKHIDVIQLKMLQSQISPHFLYNTLDSINWMLIENGEHEISSVVVALGSLLRYSIDSGNNMVKLSDELDVVRNYMIIMKVRFEDRLSYSINTEQSLEDEMVPRFLIQPLVENAVSHGIEGLCRNGSIAVKCYRTEQNVLIEVTDNGRGIPQDMINHILTTCNEQDSSGQHIGIANVLQRIKLIYGEKYGLQIKSVPGEGTKVIIILPPDLK